MSTYDACFNLVVRTEGGLSMRPEDPGNWTGGRVGAGQLKGTKYGISAAQYPSLDIANLTLDQAKAIYARDYWTPAGCPTMPGPLAYLVFDSAVQMGTPHTAQWTHQALGLLPASRFTAQTQAALERAAGRGAEVAAEFVARRTVYMASRPMWQTDGLGFARRLARLPYNAMTVGA